MPQLNQTILDVEEGEDIRETNRFLAVTAYVNYGKTLPVLLEEARCNPNAEIDQMTCDGCAINWSPRFQVVRFGDYPITQERVREQFQIAGLRPATVYELLSFAAQYGSNFNIDPIIALGSSNQSYLQKEERKKCWLRRLWRKLTKASFVKESYPMFEYHKAGNLFRLTKGDGGWQPFCMFLGVYLQKGDDPKLVDLSIGLEDYLALPDITTFPMASMKEIMAIPVGTQMKARDGHVLEMVNGLDMFQHQFAGMSVPERGFRHYRPVWKETVAA